MKKKPRQRKERYGEVLLFKENPEYRKIEKDERIWRRKK
jgi:hypothetical protein